MADAPQGTGVIRIPLQTKAKLQKVAAEQRRTLGQQLSVVLDEWIAAQEQKSSNGRHG